MTSDYGYKEKVTDEQLINLVEAGVANSIGDWLNSSDMTRERIRSTYEFAGVPLGHLSPQGVSSIVDTSTTEVIEAYTAILSDLFLNNGKIARFVPYDESPGGYKAAKDAAMITNYCIFKKNRGWEQLQSWIKSALLWKNGILRWDYVEDYDYVFEEYDKVDQDALDIILADENIELVGELNYENDIEEAQADAKLVYVNVRTRKKVDKSTVKIQNIPPESFRISRESYDIDDAKFVGIQTEMSKSDIRKMWPEVAAELTEEDWSELGNDDNWLGNARYSEDIAARKRVTGQEYWMGSVSHDLTPLEANAEVTITECWIRVDRDGDGIAELKHFILAGTHILYEADVDEIPLASLVPIDIPYEFYGLSMADFTRSSTLAFTAILRGFVENTYLTNYAPKLADPNIVDFSALQNMKPKQIIPTNGNPAQAVQPLPAETISTGTVPLLEHLQLIKEQATGMSKAAQGIQDELFVSGNSEQKLQQVQNASQKRVQHIAKRFAETGFKKMIGGVYQTMRRNMKTKQKVYQSGVYSEIDPSTLPESLEVEIMLNIGENAMNTVAQRLVQVGQQILPQLNEAGAGMVVKTDAPAALATKLIEALGLDANDYLEDYTTDEFKERAQQAHQEQSKKKEEQEQLELRKQKAEAGLAEANVEYTKSQATNTTDDNKRQMAVAIDKHFQEWADLHIKSVKEGADLPQRPDFQQIIMAAEELLAEEEQQQPQQPQQQQPQPPGGPNG